MRKNVLRRTDLSKPWLDFKLTVCIAHLEMPEFLFAACQLWQMQSIRPFVLVLDTGSTSPASREVLEELECNPAIEVARLGIRSGVEHTSDRVAHAMDYAFSRCPTEFLLSTHMDLFVQHRNVAARMMELCNDATPVVGWEMSPRGLGAKGILNGSLSDGLPGHMLTMYHVPTMDRIGAGWSLRRGHHCFGLPRGQSDVSGWPDTEVCLGKILAHHRIVPHLIGRETNAPIQITDDWVHLRSATERRLIHGGIPAFHLEAYRSAAHRLMSWIDDDLQSPPLRQNSNGKSSQKRDLCHSQRDSLDDATRILCVHPKVYVTGNIVTPEICQVCSFRKLPPPRQFRQLPGEETEIRQRPRTVSVLLLNFTDNAELERSVRSLSMQSFQPLEIVLVHGTETASPFPHLSLETEFEFRHCIPGDLTSAMENAIETVGGDIICLLPVGTVLDSTYLEQGMSCFRDPNVGIVSCRDLSADWDRLHQSASFENVGNQQPIVIGCLIRRAALFHSQPTVFDDVAPEQTVYAMIQGMLGAGWMLRRHGGIAANSGIRPDQNPEHLLESKSQRPVDDSHSRNFDRLTLFVALSGRHRTWVHLSRFLDRQTWPHSRIRLKLLDTSHDGSFSMEVRQWLALSDYLDFSYQHLPVGMPGLADRRRSSYVNEVALAMGRIYSTAARESDTEFVWTLEDDVIPPDDACERLIRGFDPNCASVSGVYRARNGRTFSVWQSGHRMISGAGTGLQRVAGNGLGCSVLRSRILRDVAMTIVVDRTAFDAAFYAQVEAIGMYAKVDWSVECKHLANSPVLE